MERMGFATRFVDLVLATVNSVRYKIVHGGHVSDSFVPGRGIRQGDPLSPYLFLICAEGFTSLIKKFEGDGLLKGCKVANGALVISHMLFADDSYVYCRANERETSNVLRLLQLFEAATGQQVNFTKSSIFFSSNTPLIIRERMCSMMRMPMADEQSTYLGLPCTMGRNKDVILGFLKDKMLKRVQSWEGRLLSKAGREVLLKTVAQALPTYAMSVFLLLVKTVSHLESLMSKYWWGSSNNRTKGVRKQGWRLLLYEDSLVGHIYKACYFPNGNFLAAEIGPNPSFIWQSVFESQQLVRDGARRRIGSGVSTPVLNVPWLISDENPCVISRHLVLAHSTVSQLMHIDRKQWDLEVLHDLFEARDVDLIMQVPLSDNVNVDSWFWGKGPNGFYSVKRSYRYLQKLKGEWGIQLESELWRVLWKVKVPPKVLHFAWKAISGCLPTRTQLRTKHVPVDPRCVFCNSDEETIIHVLVGCHFAQSCWHRSGVGLHFSAEATFADWFKAFLTGVEWLWWMSS
ncbi:uncharacterized protein LOC133030933 [Cannabis sativa]|uniref:uncharacterized protein LOC133030933 n=1 Tax=Cannabis sativa TaxID=3483 RepID=UPI0029CA6094|nr:uncharacterized protein LOC133030933 [Cannabis sativa]